MKLRAALDKHPGNNPELIKNEIYEGQIVFIDGAYSDRAHRFLCWNSWGKWESYPLNYFEPVSEPVITKKPHKAQAPRRCE